VKLADKSSNVGALAKSPPADWSLERRLNYIEWAIAVINELPQTSAEAISTFYQRCDQAELQAYIDLGSERMAQDAAIRILERKTLRSGGTHLLYYNMGKTVEIRLVNSLLETLADQRVRATKQPSPLRAFYRAKQRL